MTSPLTATWETAAVLLGNVQSSTSYRAYRMWKNSWVQACGAGWEERLMNTDFQPEKGYVWVNSACAEYYGKESVTVVTGQ